MNRFNLDSTCKRCAPEYGNHGRSGRGTRILLHIEEDIYAWADEFKVEQVVKNYVSNACPSCQRGYGDRGKDGSKRR